MNRHHAAGVAAFELNEGPGLQSSPGLHECAELGCTAFFPEEVEDLGLAAGGGAAQETRREHTAPVHDQQIVFAQVRR